MTKLSERQRASIGPRTGKPFGSTEWCWQSANFLRTLVGDLEANHRRVKQVMDELDRAHAWEKIPPDHPYGSMAALIEGETHISYAVLQDRLEVIRERDLSDQAATREGGRPKKTVNIGDGSARPRGNSQRAALRKLRASRADLHQRVLAGELTPNAAMIEAGFRHPTVSIRTDSPLSAAATIRRNAKPDFIAELIQALTHD